MADQALVRNWLRRLGRLTTGTVSEAEAFEFIDEMAPLLGLRFSDLMFTGRSLEHVAAECKYLPTYGEIVALLRDFRESCMDAPTNAPRVGDDSLGLSPKARSYVMYYRRREAEGFQPLREPDGSLSRPDVTDWQAHTLDTIKRWDEKAYAYLVAELQGQAA